MVFANEITKISSSLRKFLSCEWKFATRFASDYECDGLVHSDLIECFRGRHRGGRYFTSFLRFSRPYFVQQNEAFLPKNSCVALRGFSLRGFWDVQCFPFCGGKKGLRLPLAVGKKVRTPSFPRSEHEERGSLRPFSHRKRESQTLFPTAKGETSYIPKSP